MLDIAYKGLGVWSGLFWLPDSGEARRGGTGYRCLGRALGILWDPHHHMQPPPNCARIHPRILTSSMIIRWLRLIECVSAQGAAREAPVMPLRAAYLYLTVKVLWDKTKWSNNNEKSQPATSSEGRDGSLNGLQLEHLPHQNNAACVLKRSTRTRAHSRLLP